MKTFYEVTKEAADIANNAARMTLSDARRGLVHDEDDLTPYLLGVLRSEFRNAKIAGINIDASIARHRSGVAAEEQRYGADLLIHVAMETPSQTYSKGVLIQAKRLSEDRTMLRSDRKRLVDQCGKMLSITPASFVFQYRRHDIRCGAATRIVGGAMKNELHDLCGWTFYRFFLELFRCPIGDPRITSAKFSHLPYIALQITGELLPDLR